MTPAEMDAYINAQVNADILPEQQSIARQQAQARADSDNQIATSRAGAAALAQLLAGEGTAMQGVFDTAAQNTSGLASAFTGALQSAGNADAAKEAAYLHDVVHADPAGAAQIAGYGNAGNLHDTQQFLGGQMPAEDLVRSGLIAGIGGSVLPRIMAQRGEENVNSILTAQRKTDQGFQGRLSDLSAQIPGLRLKARSAYQDYQLKLQDQQLKQAAFDLQRRMINSRLASDKVNRKRAAALTAQGWARLTESQKQHAIDNELHNKDFKRRMKLLGISTDAELRLEATARAKARYGGTTPAQNAKWQKDAGQMAHDAFNGIYVDADSHLPVKVPSGSLPEDVNAVLAKSSYQATLADMRARGIPLAIAQKALNSYWTKAGHDQPWEQPHTGRPGASFQQRKKKVTSARGT